MWNFIKYCIYCMGITISAAFGNNPSGLTLKTGIIGLITAIIILAIVIGILFLFILILKRRR